MIQSIKPVLWRFTRGLGEVFWRSFWFSTRSITETLATVAVVFYLWACFGEGRPQRFLDGHEARVAFNQVMRGIFARGGCQQ